MITIAQLEPLPRPEPLTYVDTNGATSGHGYYRGQDIGKNIHVQFKGPEEYCNHIIVVNKKTGERIRVSF